MRGIRSQFASLVEEEGIGTDEVRAMSLGLSHSLSRYKLKFSPEKVDTMIVQVCSSCNALPHLHAARAGTPGFRPPEVIVTSNGLCGSMD